jgi:dTDP-4-dehydrorhamnose reductase
MKIILFGSNGMLGSYLKHYMGLNYVVVEITRKDINLAVANETELLSFLTKRVSKYDVIVNAAGIIKQRNCDIIEMTMVNSIFPHILAKFKDQSGCNVIHITTDCVYDGFVGGYIESNKHNCTDEYGKSKSLGENLTITNIRTSIIGEEKHNKRSLLEWVISNRDKTMDGYENHTWNGVTCLELSKLISQIIKNNAFWIGVRHVFSPDIVSKYELVSMINEVYDLNITINKKSTDNHCYRNLSTSGDRLINKPLYDQILELRDFNLKTRERGRE